MAESTDRRLVFVSDLPDFTERPTIEAVEGALGLRPAVSRIVPDADVREAIGSAIKELSEYLNTLASTTSDSVFVLDEVELLLTVSQSGKVNIFLADIGGAVQGGIRLKWRHSRRPSGQPT
jgi:hypothetical protein